MIYLKKMKFLDLKIDGNFLSGQFNPILKYTWTDF